MVKVSDKAFIKVKDLMIDEGNMNLMLRMFVQGGGCSGFTYGFTFDEVQNDDDFVIEKDGIKIIVDAMSAQYLEEATVDYKDEKFNSQFIITRLRLSLIDKRGLLYFIIYD